MLVTTPEKWDVVTRKSVGDVALSQIVKLLILDEPAAGLDPIGRSEILGGLREYQRACGATVVRVGSRIFEGIERIVK